MTDRVSRTRVSGFWKYYGEMSLRQVEKVCSIFCQILWIFDDFIEGAVDCGTLKNHQICQKFGKK